MKALAILALAALASCSSGTETRHKLSGSWVGLLWSNYPPHTPTGVSASTFALEIDFEATVEIQGAVFDLTGSVLNFPSPADRFRATGDQRGFPASPPWLWVDGGVDSTGLMSGEYMLVDRAGIVADTGVFELRRGP